MRNAELVMQRDEPCGEGWSGGRHGVGAGRKSSRSAPHTVVLTSANFPKTDKTR